MTAAEKQALLQALDHLSEANADILKVLRDIATGYEIECEDAARSLGFANENLERLRVLFFGGGV